MNEIKRKRAAMLGIALSFLLILSCACVLLYTGIIHINNPSIAKYPIRGVDVSHYQGEIDWEQLSAENIRFAYIKATEGSRYKDEQFDKNWDEAQSTGLRIGAYHFFSLDSSGATQADNFCRTVTMVDAMLPPVVDVELYGKYRDINQIDKERFFLELGDYLKAVELYYTMKPVIYTTEECLPLIQEEFTDYDVWIRNVYGKPDSSIDWTFWQFSNRHVLSGYSGTERYIDMNVFVGDEKDFLSYDGT